MFTGIIQELGSVKKIERSGSIYDLHILAEDICKNVMIGDSVAVNGVCLTVTSKLNNVMNFNIMAETVRKTSLASLRKSDMVNLEPSLKIGGTLDGHFVLGHIDCVGNVMNISKSGGEFEIAVAFPEEFNNLAVDRGSIAIEGVSLTVSRIGKGSMSVHIIPHTSKHTTLDSKKAGDAVNLEFDILGKYVLKQGEAGKRPAITEEFLRSKGF